MSKLIDESKILQNRTDDIIEFIDKTSDVIEKVVRLNHFHKLKIDNLKKIDKNPEYEINNNLNQCDNLNKQSAVLLNESRDNIDNLKDLSPKLETFMNRLLTNVEIYERLNFEYNSTYFNPVKNYVENLMKLASKYQKYFFIYTAYFNTISFECHWFS